MAECWGASWVVSTVDLSEKQRAGLKAVCWAEMMVVLKADDLVADLDESRAVRSVALMVSHWAGRKADLSEQKQVDQSVVHLAGVKVVLWAESTADLWAYHLAEPRAVRMAAELVVHLVVSLV